jgi:hypothetical protein
LAGLQPSRHEHRLLNQPALLLFNHRQTGNKLESLSNKLGSGAALTHSGKNRGNNRAKDKSTIPVLRDALATSQAVRLGRTNPRPKKQ